MVMNNGRTASKVRLGQAFEQAADSTENRIDEDEQIIGALNARGSIIRVLDEHAGVVRVLTDQGDEVTARIDDWYAPQPHLGTRVEVRQSASADALAKPIGALFPPQFKVQIVSGQNGNDDGYHSAIGEHHYPELGSTRVAVVGSIGQPLAVNDIVLCGVEYPMNRASAQSTPSPTIIQVIAKSRAGV